MTTIRDASEADIEAITAIYRDAVENGTASYELEAPDLAEMQRRFAEISRGGYPYIVVEEGGEILGYAYGGPFRARPAYRFAVENSVYLAAHAQKRGLGRQLLAELIDRCQQAGFRQMIAVIGDGSDDSSSVKLHTALAFQHCGTLVGSGYKHGRWLNTVLMQLPLNGGNDLPPDPHSLPEQRFRGEA